MGKHTKIGVLSFFSTFGTLDITEDQLHGRVQFNGSN
jgi:hypothetical protein